MAKRERTQAQIEADKARMARVRAKRAANITPVIDPENSDPGPDLWPEKPAKGITLTQEQFAEIMTRLEKAEEHKTHTETSVPQGSGFDQFGKPVGVIQKYSVDPAHYNDPRQHLSGLPELERIAFSHNYILDWDVEQLIYDTKYGSSFSEPKFTLILWRKMFDEDGTPNGKRVLIQTGVFFEDPITAVKEATQLGIPIDNSTSSEFLEQMRFLRYKQWLMDIFNPKRSVNTKPKRTPQVIGGMVVEVEEYSNVV